MDAQSSPSGDELRTRAYLRRLGARPLGHQEPPMPDIPAPRRSTNRLPAWWSTKPDQLPDAAEPEPATDTSTDWWDDLYQDDDTTTPAQEPTDEPADEPTAVPDAADAATRWWTAQPGYYPRPHTPAWFTAPPARVPLSPKTRAALYNASAAGTGWAIGLYDPFAEALASCGTDYSVGGALVLGAGGCLLIAHLWDRRTRHWWPGLAWAARIPLATAICALALWAPATP